MRSLLRLLALFRALVETPCLRAIRSKASPFLTVYERVLGAVGFLVEVDFLAVLFLVPDDEAVEVFLEGGL